jgi:hypothetical protein
MTAPIPSPVGPIRRVGAWTPILPNRPTVNTTDPTEAPLRETLRIEGVLATGRGRLISEPCRISRSVALPGEGTGENVPYFAG